MRKLILKARFFLPLTVVFLVLSMAHPFYLGVCEFKYNQPRKELQGSVKLFTNDLEDALKKLNKKPVDLLNIKDTVMVSKLLEEYLRKRLQLKVNGTVISYRFLGFEKEEEATWMYIEALNCPPPKKVEINCSLLYDFIKEQMLIFHVEAGSDKKSHKLTNPERLVTLDF